MMATRQGERFVYSLRRSQQEEGSFSYCCDVMAKTGGFRHNRRKGIIDVKQTSQGKYRFFGEEVFLLISSGVSLLRPTTASTLTMFAGSSQNTLKLFQPLQLVLLLSLVPSSTGPFLMSHYGKFSGQNVRVHHFATTSRGSIMMLCFQGCEYRSLYATSTGTWHFLAGKDACVQSRVSNETREFQAC